MSPGTSQALATEDPIQATPDSCEYLSQCIGGLSVYSFRRKPGLPGTCHVELPICLVSNFLRFVACGYGVCK